MHRTTSPTSSSTKPSGESGGIGGFRTLGLLESISQIDLHPLVYALTVVVGMQSIRTFVPLCTFYFYDVRDVDPLFTALLAFLVLGSGWVSPWVHRSLPSAGLPAVGILLATCRLAEQATSQPGLDLLWSGLATALFVIALPIHFLELPPGHKWSAASDHLGPAFLLGLLIDLVLHLRLRTLDLSWQTGLWPYVVLVPICLLLAVLSIATRTKRPESAGPSRLRGLPAEYVLLGLWLVCYVQVLGNPASLASYTGLSWRYVTEIFALSLLLQFGAIIFLRNHWEKAQWNWLLAPMVGACIMFYVVGDRWSIGAQLLGSTLGGLLALRIHARLAIPSKTVDSFFLSSLTCASGPLVFIILLFLYYASFEYRLGFLSKHVLLASAAGLGLGGLGLFRRPLPAIAHRNAWLPLLLIALLLSGLPILSEHTHQPKPTSPGLRLMTYNIHQGFNTSGRLDPEAIATEIEASGATVVALQEVSRGWVVNGSADLLGWLAARLDMFGYFGATADPLWGNAILSRQPLESFESHSLPPDNLSLRRGYLDARLRVDDLSVRILVTHLHHRRADSEVRGIQVRDLLKSWDGTGSTLIVGDLNADPMSVAMKAFQSSGFTSAATMLPPDRRATVLRPSGDRQIDYIWVTPDLAVEKVAIPISSASDHLPLVATIEASPMR